MLLHIYPSIPIADIQDHFSKCFPGLKIEFFSKLHHSGQPSDMKFIIPQFALVGQARPGLVPGDLKLQSTYTVSQVETLFHERFGLNVQVYRNDNGKWVQTTHTDEQTLAQQQELASRSNPSSPTYQNDTQDEYEFS